jgi:hypothetical protein
MIQLKTQSKDKSARKLAQNPHYKDIKRNQQMERKREIEKVTVHESQ